jgi:hypothetical protein
MGIHSLWYLSTQICKILLLFGQYFIRQHKLDPNAFIGYYYLIRMSKIGPEFICKGNFKEILVLSWVKFSQR